MSRLCDRFSNSDARDKGFNLAPTLGFRGDSTSRSHVTFAVDCCTSEGPSTVAFGFLLFLHLAVILHEFGEVNFMISSFSNSLVHLDLTEQYGAVIEEPESAHQVDTILLLDISIVVLIQSVEQVFQEL